MEDGIERSMSMLIQENEQKKQTVQKPPNKTPQWPPSVSVLRASTMPEQVHPVGLSLPTDRSASSYPLRTDTPQLTSTNSGS
jgi:hypothetical protein